MTFVNAAGTVLNKTEMLALTTEEDPTVIRVFTEDVYTKFTYPGGAFEGGTKLLYHEGQEVPESEIDGLFVAATITDITPATGPAAGGTVVTIDGTNLAGAEGVTFGGTAGTAFKRISNTRVQVTTPAKAAAAYNVVVLDDAGNVTEVNGFTYS
jgi:hypothetical protein